MDEFHQGRRYESIEGCHFCHADAEWFVTEAESGETMTVCHLHKFTAFS